MASEKDASSWLTVLLDRNIGMVLVYIRLVFMMPLASHLDMADGMMPSEGSPALPLSGARFTTHVQKRLSSI